MLHECSGYLVVIRGSMFSGKTNELIRLANRAHYANMGVAVFKPRKDTRSNYMLKSHDGETFEAIEVESADEILDHALLPFAGVEFVGIEEAQFFDEDIVTVCETLVANGIYTVVAGLNLDFRGEPFGHMPELLARADDVIALTAICVVEGCRNVATRTQRIVNGIPAFYDDPIIMIGAHESYEPRCRVHHEVPHREGRYYFRD